MFVYSIFIFSPRFCFAHFWARSKSSKYLQQKHGVMAVKRKTIHNLVMREIFVSRAGDLSHAGDRPKYREPPAQVVRVNRYGLKDTFSKKFFLFLNLFAYKWTKNVCLSSITIEKKVGEKNPKPNMVQLV